MHGIAPPGFRLPESARVGSVRLQVSDLQQSIEYYERVIGLRVHGASDDTATMGAHGGERPLVSLHTAPGIRPASRGAFGLYHFAILLPDRAALGRFVGHLGELEVSAGAGDHLVSEAFYLYDPDGLGIEVYADRPRETWRRNGRELVMTTDPVDVNDLVRAAGDAPWSGMPAGTIIGHVHLHVGTIPEAAAFYADAVGFDVTTAAYPGALFLAAGGYHHHLGTNTWAGPDARPPADDDARLLEWSIEVPGDDDVAEVMRSLREAGYDAERGDDGSADIVTRDPWGTAVRVKATS